MAMDTPQIDKDGNGILFYGDAKVNFVKGKSIILKMSFSSFEMQLLRATRFQNLLRQRLGEK